MNKLQLNLRLLFSGDTVLLGISVWLFMASLANGTGLPVLRGFRFCGICTLLLSSGFLLCSSMELRKSERRKRTILSALLLLAGIIITLSTCVHVSAGDE